MESSRIDELKNKLSKVSSQKKRRNILEKTDTTGFSAEELERFHALEQKANQPYSKLKLFIIIGAVAYIPAWIICIFGIGFFMGLNLDGLGLLAAVIYLLIMIIPIWCLAGIPVEIVLLLILLKRRKNSDYYLNISPI